MIAVGADKGSPGASATALVLASSWPEPATLVETDPWGGDLLLRVRRNREVLADRETVLSLAAAASAARDSEGRAPSMNSDLVARYCQSLSAQVDVVPSPLLAERTQAVADWRTLAAALSASARPVVADLGRIGAGSPTMPVAAAAQTLVMVCRGETASVIRLRERLLTLVPALAEAKGTAPKVIPVVISHHRYGPADAADLLAAFKDSPVEPFVPGAGWLAWDEEALTRLYAGEDSSGRGLGKSRLMRSAAALLGLIRPHVSTISSLNGAGWSTAGVGS